MSNFRKNHLALSGVLFAIAITLYIIGFSSGAVVASVAAVLVEITAWIALSFESRRRIASDDKQ